MTARREGAAGDAGRRHETSSLSHRRIHSHASRLAKFERHGREAQGYSIDSRTVQPGELFFAVKGERLDGHDFVEQALEPGRDCAR